MNDDTKPKSNEDALHDDDLKSRREFLVGLKKWSKIVIGGILVGGALVSPDRDAEAGWINRRGGGGGGWANRGGSWVNRGGGSWVNRGGGGGWVNRGGGGGWVNRGGGGWANRRGGGGWANRR